MNAPRPVRMVSTGSYLPGEPISNAALERLVGPLPAESSKASRSEPRYWMVDPQTGEHRETNSEMATAAARQAL